MFENLPKSWKRGFEAAAAASEYSNGNHPGERMGAALYSGSVQVSLGFNIYNKTHPVSQHLSKNVSKIGQKYNGSIHAEMSALIKRRHYNDSNQIIYVYRHKNINGKICLANSMPCKICQDYLKLARVKIARYINDDGTFAEMKIER